MATTAELCERSGISYRQADYWTTEGVLKATGGGGPGIPREYTDEEVGVARGLCVVMNVLLAGGRKLPKLAEIAEALRAGKKGKLELAPGVTVDLKKLTAGDQ